MDELNEKIEGLVKKAEKSGMPYGILKKVYDRGMAAWRTGHRPGTTPQQWAFARVNSFVTKSSGTWGGADKDLAKKVRGEEVEKRKTAKDMIGQVKEKLGKDADAGDFVKDFRKSKAPQFKGKSDKKIQKMAIAAYLDSKEEVKEENLQELINFDRQLKDPKKETMVMFTKGSDKGKGFVIDKKDLSKFEKRGAIRIESNDIQESGHQDVPSMKTQVQIAMDALQKMNTELGKLSDEDELPTWWTNKVATAVNKLDGMADYIDAMHDRGQQMAEEHEAILSELTEKFTKVSPQVIDKIKGMMKDPKQKESLKNIMTHLMPKEVVKMLHKEIPATKSLSEEEVDNSLMAQATRVISDTSIKEKIDPADIDMKATAADRKAADKNIIIQLRRAQDMVKQTGRQDQTGIEFLDRKKQKIDSKIINKALDMFDKMKPNDKAKMQKTIGKSYRDLLKTVQRGRI